MSAEAYTLVVPGAPTGKGRPRFNRASGHAVTPAKTRLAENRVYLAWVEAGQPRFPEGALTMRVEAVLERPQSHWKRDGTLSAAGWRSHHPTKAPDADNLLKLAADALNGNGFRDDAQIVMALVRKRWANAGEAPHTLITVRLLSGAALEEAA